MEKNRTTPNNEPENSAQGLLRRLNSRYDSAKVESEKSAMQRLDDMTDTDSDAPDVIEYTEEKKVTDSDLAVSRAELQNLFDKYLGKEQAPTAKEPTEVPTEEPANMAPVNEPLPMSDVERNINEAEKYIDAIITGERESIRDPNAAVPTVETDVFEKTPGITEMLSAYTPQTVRMEDGEVKATPQTSEPPVITDETEIPSDTAMLKAFGLHPKSEITEETSRIFDSFGFSETGDLQSTEEISTNEKEGETAAAVAVPENKRADFEYTDPAQNKPIIAAFKKKYSFAKIKMVLSGFLALILLLLENISPITELFAGKREIFIGIDWLLFFLSAALIADQLFAAAKRVAKFEITPDTITLTAFFLSVITTLITAFSMHSYTVPKMYSFGFAVCVFFSAAASFISLRRDVYSFKIVSSGKVKKTLSRADNAEARIPELSEFSDYLDADSEVATIRRTDFVTDFFARRKEFPFSMSSMKIFVPACLGVALLVFFLALFAVDLTAAESAGSAYATFLMSAPFAAFISYTYPLYLASRRAYTYNSAIVGDKTTDDYLNTAVVAFRDEDAFPAGKLRISGIKIYADRNIASAVYYASGVFSKIGGPLSAVFKGATLNSVVPKDVEIREIANEGICATVDGKNIVVGRPSYMENQCFETLPDEGDENFEGRTNKRILYLACEQIIIAKFYIQYNTTSDFLYNLRHLTDAGICTAIRTADPCIDEEILYSNKMNPEKYPIKIVKGMAVEEKAESISAHKGGIVSVGSAKDMVRTLMLCEKLGNVSKTTLILKAVASLLGFAVMMLLLFTGKTPSLISIFPAIYQCFWLLPTIFVSKIYI